MEPTATDLDGQLIRRTASGDRDAFVALAERHRDSLFRYLRSLVRTDEAAEDALQEVWVGVWRGAGGYRGESAGRVWLFGLARRHAARSWRRRVGEPVDAAPLDAQAAGFAAEDCDPEVLAARAEDAVRLHAALDQLSEADREVLIVRDLEGMTGPEAAEVLGIELAALKTRLHRARLRLMAALRGGTADDR